MCLQSSRVCYATMQGLAQDADKYKATAAHVELSKKMYKRDPATAPVVGDRVPYVIIKVSPLLQSMAADNWSLTQVRYYIKRFPDDNSITFATLVRHFVLMFATGQQGLQT